MFNLSCPYDVLKIYDYQKTTDSESEKSSKETRSNQVKQSISIKSLQPDQQLERVLIESYCGRKLNFTLYSTSNQFEIEFEMFDSLGNEEYSEDESKILLRKGFKAFFKFSKYFADLSFITGNHITGTSAFKSC